MADHLSRILLRRLVDIRSRKDELQVEISSLTDEENKVQTAAKAVGIDLEAEHLRMPLIPSNSGVTIQSAALAVLYDNPCGLRASDLIAKINHQYGFSYSRDSVAPPT